MPVHYYDTKHPWIILLQFKGSVWSSVLPYCILNCGITYLVYYLKSHDVKVTFSAQGHALMSLIVSYLVVSKVYLSLDRYMSARTFAGSALVLLRELNQLILTFTEAQGGVEARVWRRDAREKISELLHSTIRVVRVEEKASYLARNEPPITDDDPMLHAQLLRSHLYNGSNILPTDLHILEKSKMIDLLNLYLQAYRELLKLASTPLPFTMIQMGRTFLFLWVFSIPMALVGVIDEIVSVVIFVFFLTYGFIGMELISMKLLHPFGDGVNDINITGMGEATVVGMENDTRVVESRWTKQVSESSKSVAGNSDTKILPMGSAGGDKYAGGQGAHDQSHSTMGSVADHYYAFP